MTRWTFRGVVAWALLALLAVQAAWAADPLCRSNWAERLVKGIRAPGVNQQQAYEWYRRVQTFDEEAFRGVLTGLQVDPFKGQLDLMFDLLKRSPDANLLGTDEAVFRVIGKLTELKDGVFVAPEGVVTTMRNLLSNSNSSIGALFDLKIADDALSAGKKAGFAHRVEFPVGNVTPRRDYDVIELDEFAPPELGGIVHENKNWLSPLSGPDDGLLAGFADEFRRDILLHSTSSFAFYRMNLRKIVEGQSKLIRNKLLQQFDDPFVTRNLDSDTIDDMRQEFTRLWDEGLIVKFY